MRSCHRWFFLGSYSQLLFLPFQLHSGGHFIIIIIDYCAPSRKSPEHLRRHKDTLISWQTHARPHTHYKYLHYWWWIGKTTSVCRGEEMGFHHFLHHQHHHLPSCQNREEEVGVWDVWRSCAAWSTPGLPCLPFVAEDTDDRGGNATSVLPHQCFAAQLYV